MSSWKVVVPRQGYNLVLNPSAETTGNYAARGGAVITRETSTSTGVPNSVFGIYGYGIACANAGDGIDLTMDWLWDQDVYVASIFSQGQITNWRWCIDGATWLTPELVMQVNDYWYWYEARQAAWGGPTTTFTIEYTGAGAYTMMLDGAMVTPINSSDLDRPITYIDGDQDGCTWYVQPHGSASYCTAHVRSQGFLYDLEDDLHFDVGTVVGAGAATHTISTTGLALLPGAQISGERLERRSFALGGVIRGASWETFHENKQELLLALSGQVVPESGGQKQPVQLWYTGASTVKRIDAYYESGLEARLDAGVDPCYWEQNVAVQLVSPDPLWRSVVERSVRLSQPIYLTIHDILVTRLIAPITTNLNFGEWETNIAWTHSVAVGAGGNRRVYCTTWGPDGKLYFGGDFANYDSQATCDHIAVVDQINGVQPLGGGLNGPVYALCFGPDGTLYAGGAFTAAGGDPNANYIAQIDPDAAVPAWSAVGTGPGAATGHGAAGTPVVYALCIDRNGSLIVGGDFETWNGDADNDNAVRWDGAVWQKISTKELNNAVYALVTSPDGWVYFGGSFTETAGAGSITLNRLAKWKQGESDYAYLDAGGRGVDGIVRALAVDATGRRVWIGGDFTASTGGETLNYIGLWNGTNFEALGSGVTDVVRGIALGPDDALWVVGDFTTITGMGACSGVAKYVGASWCPVDIQTVPNVDIYSVALSSAVPPSVRNYPVALGWDSIAATIYVPYQQYLQNDSTWLVYPKIIFHRNGAVTGRLGNVRIGPTGAELYLNYTLQLNETLTVDTDPFKKTVVSSFWGNRQDAILPPSDLGAFALLPHLSQGQYTDVWMFSETAGDANIEYLLLWRETFESQD